MNWGSGAYPGNNPPLANTFVCLAYHTLASGAAEPALNAGAGSWQVFEGVRSCLPPGASNMLDFWTLYNNGQPIPPGSEADP